MANQFKILLLPGELNDTPDKQDLILLVTEEEFLKMWKRGEAMLRNRRLKGKHGIQDQGNLGTGSVEVN